MHTKLYAWFSGNKPIRGFAGSANYTQNAFFSSQREILVEYEPTELLRYFASLEKKTMPCTDSEVEKSIQIYKDRRKDGRPNQGIIPKTTEKEIPPHLTNAPITSVSLLTRSGSVGTASGLNWGQRAGREPNQAYIPLKAEVYKSDFFPERARHFTVITDDDEIFICTRAQDNGKAIHTPHNNSLLGEYFRQRLGIALGTVVSMTDFKRYGRTDVGFYKIDDETYYMDFSPS